MQAFKREYMLTDRLLGGGAYGKVYMAISNFQRRQLACKVVDLRPLKVPAKRRMNRREQHAQAEDVDSRVQLRKLTALVDEKKREHLLEDELKKRYREFNLLASIDHVSPLRLLAVCLLISYSQTSSDSKRSS
jgi:hypothetical protein